jgi:lipopolysaccharide/colanic/teichoic acid biosynthesis glycosyltransferase
VDDPRITRVGRFLRATGLDELPQLVNIARGDMSFVGPRALAVGETVEIEPGTRVAYEDIPEFAERQSVRPGLTGQATIYLPKDAPAAQKFETDLRYVRNWSVWGDLKLIGLSFVISFRGRWETRDPKL